MRQIQIILAGSTRLLADLIKDAIAQQPNMVLVKEIEHTNEVAHYVEQSKADVVILRLKAERLEQFCIPLIRSFPDLLVVSLANNERVLLRCELHPRVLECGEASIDNLISYLQAHARRTTRDAQFAKGS